MHQRNLPIGAEFVPEGGVHFRVWSSRRTKVEVVIDGGEAFELTPEGNGYFSGLNTSATPGTRYRYRLDDGQSFPDPISRFQPEGPHGPSVVIDPSFAWSDDSWKGIRREGQIVYELHVGTFTMDGTWDAAADRLPYLVELGISVVEVMPVADFPGNFGWGYDGVNLFAPTRLYGSPDDFKRFVNRAHKLGLGVILDVVYNHFGPEGNYLNQFSGDYVTDKIPTEWGEAINFCGNNSGPVREFFISNAVYWISEFHLDGLRLDATQVIYDASEEHIIESIVQASRRAAGDRTVIIVAEMEDQKSKLVRSVENGGYGVDAAWNDDFHHSAHVALTGYNEAYYAEYTGTPQELISAIKWGYLYQGQRYFWQGKRRGTPTRGLDHSSFVHYIQNHDQIANSARGFRLNLLTSPGRLRAMTALLLLGPATPMLFQGQEFACSSPFLYFVDLSSDLAEAVREGRAGFLKQFKNVNVPEILDILDHPSDPATFEKCRIRWDDLEKNRDAYRLHQDLIRLRKDDPVFSLTWKVDIECAVLGPEAFLIRYYSGHEQRLLLLNLGRTLDLRPAPEPLLAPPRKRTWQILWSSEQPEYGGSGTPVLETDVSWKIPGHAAVALIPVPEGDDICP